MNKDEFIKHKMKILVGKEGYNRNQAYAISLSLWSKEGGKKNYAQQAGYPNIMNNYEPPTFQNLPQNRNSQMFQTPPQNINPSIGYNMGNYQSLSLPNKPNSANTFANNNQLPFEQPIQNNIGYNPLDLKQDYSKYLYNSNTIDQQQNQDQQHQNERVNIINPFGGGYSLDQSITAAGQGFGEGNYGKAGLATGLSLLKGARNFMSGYAGGKESGRVQNEYLDNTYNAPIKYDFRQQGGDMQINGYSNNQKPIKNMYEVMTEGIREGNLPPGYYQKVIYKDGTQDYVRKENLGEFKRMPNYINYMQLLGKNKNNIPPDNRMANEYQQGGSIKNSDIIYYSNQLKGKKIIGYVLNKETNSYEVEYE